MSEPVEIECSICGRDGGAYPDCGMCSGRAQNQEKNFTLSEHRSGRGPVEDRYGNDGGLNIRTPNLPGGAVNHPGGRQ